MDPDARLEQKLRKRVRNQAKFFKHAIVFGVLFIFFMFLSTIIGDPDARKGIRIPDPRIGFGMMFLFWGIGLVFHGLNAFVFNRIDSWEETRLRRESLRLNLSSPEDDLDLPEDLNDPDSEEPMDLKSYGRLREEMDKKWGEGDFV